MCVLLPCGPPFVLDLFLAVGQTSSVLPRAGWQPLLLQQLQPPFCRLCRSPALPCGAGGVRGSLCARAVPVLRDRRAVLGCPCPAPGHRAAPQQSRPAAGFVRLFSSELQLVPRAQPPACFWEPSAELRALCRGQGDPACSCLRTLFLRPVALPSLQRARVWLWCSAPSSLWRSLDRQPGLAAPGRDRRCCRCLGETLAPRRCRGTARAEPAPLLRVSQGFPWYVTSCAPSGMFGGNRLCSGSAPWLRPGEAEQKLRVRCPEREDRRGQERTGEEGPRRSA